MVVGFRIVKINANVCVISQVAPNLAIAIIAAGGGASISLGVFDVFSNRYFKNSSSL